ncbi:MAG TPA: hypothetical protein VFB80_05100 [Pirellulaceae bacterium]|nr:hypothetical protein [Pirellulaceae bacterium]
MQITSQQLQAIDNGEPVPLVVEGRPCILVPGTIDQLRDALDDWDPRTMQRHMARLMADDWNDPAMSAYDE